MQQERHPRWAIIVHGGATEIPEEKRADYREGCERAASAGRRVLEAGGPATEAVVAAVRVLEADRTFNAGIGSVLNADGKVQADASVMDGATLDVGAVAAIEHVRHPVEVAAALLREEEVLLVADGAERFAREHGLEGPALTALTTGETEAHDTVGCVALDADGHIATAVSTGGLPDAPAGRVGDSPLPGGGFYADDRVGGVVFSGSGERIARLALGAWAIARLGDDDPVTTAGGAIAELERVGGDAGVIIVDRLGRVGWAHNSPDFAVAWATSEHRLQSFTEAPRPGGSDAPKEAAA